MVVQPASGFTLALHCTSRHCFAFALPLPSKSCICMPGRRASTPTSPSPSLATSTGLALWYARLDSVQHKIIRVSIDRHPTIRHHVSNSVPTKLWDVPTKPLGRPKKNLGRPNKTLGRPKTILGRPKKSLGRPIDFLGYNRDKFPGVRLVCQCKSTPPCQLAWSGCSAPAHECLAHHELQSSSTLY